MKHSLINNAYDCSFAARTKNGLKKPNLKAIRTGSATPLGLHPSDYRERSLPAARKIAASSFGLMTACRVAGPSECYIHSKTLSGTFHGQSQATSWPSREVTTKSAYGRKQWKASGFALAMSVGERGLRPVNSETVKRNNLFRLRSLVILENL